jgi:very-short-patch-repair endonuclease
VGHSVPVALAREQGALLACGDAALLSHESAALLWRMPVQLPETVQVTLVGCARPQRAGIRIHRVPALDPRDIRRHKGLPLTAPARTLLDLAAVVPKEALEQAVAEAIARHLVSTPALREALERAPRRHGAKSLRKLLDREAPPARTRSKPERLMLGIVRRLGLPEPETNIQLEEWNVDFLWRDRRLVVEVDTYSFHSSPASWERDHRKQADLEDCGLTVRRVTKRQLEEQPDSVAERLKRWLEAT